MNDKLRKTLPLVGALALTSSALFAGAGAVAAKPVPDAVVKDANCDEQVIGTTTRTVYTVQYDLSVNKGRWLYGGAVFRAGTTDHETTLDPNKRIDKKGNLQVDAKVAGPGQSGTMVLTFLDRKGAAIGTHETEFVESQCD
jgi:hypothetical protein